MFKALFAAVNAALTFYFLSGQLLAEAPDANVWTQWRGPHRDSQIGSAQWPADLSEKHLTEKWTVAQGPSYSGPIVTADRVFITETKDKKFEVVRALRRSTGEQLWEVQWEGAVKVPFFAATNGSWIRATPAFDGQRLYVAGMRDVLVCLNAETGQIIWKVDFVEQTGSPLPSFGFVSSPLLVGDHVFVQAGAGFAKLDKLTGEIIWHTAKDGGGMFGSAFSSPVFATIDGVDQLVVQSRTKMMGIAPEDGKLLWSQEIPAFRGMNILPPTVIGNTVFTSSYGGRSFLFEISHNDSDWKVTELWNHRTQGYMSAPVVIDGHIYMHLKNKRFVCLNLVTGEERWTTTPFGNYWSMIANGTKLLVLDERGELLLIEASPDEFKLVDRRQVAEDAWAHLAIAGDEVFVRDLNALKMLEWK